VNGLPVSAWKGEQIPNGNKRYYVSPSKEFSLFPKFVSAKRSFDRLRGGFIDVFIVVKSWTGIADSEEPSVPL